MPRPSACREVPDVSAQADEFTGAITVVYDGSWTGFGGTSSSTPLWAAMTAEMSASAACGTAGAGFIDPELYAVASNPAQYAASFNDITKGNNDPFGATRGLYPATKGYDMASGLGTPKVTGPGGTAGLAHYLCAQSTSVAAPVITGISPASVPTGGGTVTVTGTGFASGAISQIAGVQLGGVPLPNAVVASSVKATSFRLAVPAAPVFVPPDTATDGAGRYYLSVTSTNGSTSRVGPKSALQVVGSTATTRPVVTGVGPSGANESGDNGATPITTTVYGSGFVGATSVRFGAVASTHFTVENANEITATVPPFKAGTTACLADGVGICQVQVVVTTAAGSSAAHDSTILPPYQGAYALDNSGDFTPPAGCGCEAAPQPTEFDYLPTPRITGLTADVAANGKSYASEAGGTVVTLTGVGFAVLGFEWLDGGGAPNLYNSFFSPGISYISATKIQFVMPGPARIPNRRAAFSVPFYIQTLASPNSGNISAPAPAPSNQTRVVFAPTPEVTSVSTGSSPAAGSVHRGHEADHQGIGVRRRLRGGVHR